MQSVDTQALLLRSIDYLEADRVLTLLTPTLGKVSVLARGARSSRRRFAGALESCALLDVTLSPGRGELGSLRGAQLTRPFSRLTSHLERIAAAGAALELVREVTAPRNPDPALFATTVRCLELLDATDERVDEVLLSFKLRVMDLVGLAPNVRACGRCGRKPGDEQPSLFDPTVGSIVCRACGGGSVLLSAAVRTTMLRALGPTWEDAVRVRWPEADRSAIQTTVDHLITYELRKELRGSQALSATQEVLRGGGPGSQ